MTQPDSSAYATLAAAILEKVRTELLWRLRPATVLHPGPTGTVDRIQATYDGDPTPVRMTSLIGTIAAGTRVMVIFVPPAGSYIIGYAGVPPGGTP